jgi:beta-1,4-mannosyl-glycoprotein beta-1,4-N-acetylglucosaminyltransferase
MKNNRLIIKPFLFKNELDLLEIQLEELYDVVDYFVLLETERSFQNTIREDFGTYEKNKSKFEKFNDKILYTKLFKDQYDSNYEFVTPRQKRNYNYEILKEVVRNYNFPNDTIVLYGDCDEIPNRNIVEKIRNNEIPVNEQTIINLQMDLYYFYFNYKCTSHPWLGFKLVSLPIFLNNQIYETVRCAHDKQQLPTINNCGWHYSYFGDVDYVLDKINTLSHVENKTEKIMNRTNIAESMKTGRDIYFRNNHFWKILQESETTLPRAVINNKEKYKKYFHA